MLIDDPVDQSVNFWIIFLCQISLVTPQMLEMILLGHRRFVDVIIGSKTVIVRDLGQFLHVILIDVRDIDVDHRSVTVIVFLLDHVIKIRPDAIQRFRQARLFNYGIDGEIDICHARITDLIQHFRFHETSVCWKVNEKILLGRVIDDLVNEIGADQRLTAHQSKDAIAYGMQPVNGSSRCRLRHPAHLVVIGPAVVAINIALKFAEEIRNDRPEFLAMPARLKIWSGPPLQSANCVQFVVLLFSVIITCRPLRKNRIRQTEVFGNVGRRGFLLSSH